MHRTMAGDDLGLVVVTHVDLRKVAQGHDQRPHQKRQQGQLAATVAVLVVEMHAQLFEGGDIDLLDIAEVCGAARGVLHALGDLAAQADHRDLFFIGTPRVAAADGLRRLFGLGQVGVEVVVQNASGRAAAVDKTQFDPGIPGTFTHRWRGQQGPAWLAAPRCLHERCQHLRLRC